MHSAVLLNFGSTEPPREFRIFRAGANETTKGTFIFDAESARSVMSEYRKHGTDLMIDYDHASLDIGFDPSLSGRAAGWFEPAVRGGDLYAVNVRWTPGAAQALRSKEWRYMSPAFSLKGNRITALINVALTNLPATRGLEPLIAASSRGGGGGGDVDAIIEQIAMRSLTPEQRRLCQEYGCTALDFRAVHLLHGGWRR